MSSFFDLQRWLYAGIAGNLDQVATRNVWTLVSVMAAAMVFGAAHALIQGTARPCSCHIILRVPPICGKDFSVG
jgi:hypothetical protein